MKTDIYYFSATGNSLVIARELAAKLDARLIPIAALPEGEPVRPEAEAVGIVTPVYFNEIPVIVKRFAGRLTGLAGKYVFAVCNFGGAAGYAFQALRETLEASGGVLSAGYCVHMPQSAFHKPWEKTDKIYRASGKRLDRIAKYIQARKKGVFRTNVLLELMFSSLHKYLKPSFKEGIRKYSDASPDLSSDELIALTDMSYRVNENCTGCGTCARVCPVGNIRLEGERPVWLNRCEACLACYNWCPGKAIEGGVAAEGYYYRHPGVKLADMIQAKSGGLGVQSQM